MPDNLGFPKNFLWGAATSSHQAEGGNHNDWSEWERSELRIKNLESRMKNPEFHDQFPEHILKRWPSPLDLENYISGRACDHYHRFREDFDIAKQLGHNAYRFSLEWSRIEPEEGRFDEREIEHYREVIAALSERDLEPFVTLWHWTLPLWLRDKGGIASKSFPAYFERYVSAVAECLKDRVKFWMTINEPTSVIGMAYGRGQWPPGKRSPLAALRAFRILAHAHCVAYRAIHAVCPSAQVGFGNVLSFIEPARPRHPLDRLVARVGDFWANRYFFLLTGDTPHDYIAIHSYFHNRIAFPWRLRNENKKVSDMGWELYPDSLYHVLNMWAAKKKPIYITEHGLADARDEDRIWYIREGIAAIRRARREGADVRGYFHWSLLDNFEWDKGFWPRFGLVEVDYKTMERRIRPSAWEYKNIIEQSAKRS